jgi:hypothetical protein
LVLVAAGLRARRACAGRDARTTEKPEISIAHSIFLGGPQALGGERSGKSRWALTAAAAVSGHKAFIATAEAFDEEMKVRIAAHQRDRGAEIL